MPGTTLTALPSLSHDQHHKIEGGGTERQRKTQTDIALQWLTSDTWEEPV